MRGFLVDGMPAGAGRLERSKNPVLQVVPFRPLNRAERSAVEEEAHRLPAFSTGSTAGGGRGVVHLEPA
jgi:hypothetical protein